MEHHRLLLKFRLYGLLFVALWGGQAWYQASLGHTIIATLVALPVVAMILALVSPLAGPGHFALTQELGGVADSSLTLRQQEIQKALWWLVGSCLLPLGALLAFVAGVTGWFEKGHAIFVVFGGLLAAGGYCMLPQGSRGILQSLAGQHMNAEATDRTGRPGVLSYILALCLTVWIGPA